MGVEPEFVYSIRDEAVKLRPQPSRPQSSRRARSDGQPPANAQVCYKAVASAPDGRMYAIFDGQTEYKLQTTTHALWQTLLESTCVKPPEVYQTHLHVKKVNRKGVPQTRTIVVTDKRLYNIEREGQVLREPKWSCAVEALSGVEVQELDDKKLPSEKWSVTLRMKPKQQLRRGSTNSAAVHLGRLSGSTRPLVEAETDNEKEAFNFAVKTEEELEALVASIRQGYFAHTRQQLGIHRPNQTATVAVQPGRSSVYTGAL